MYTSIVENDVILAIVNTAMKNLSDEERIDRATVRIMNLIGFAIISDKFIDIHTLGKATVVLSVFDGIYILTFKCEVINGDIRVSIVEIANSIVNKDTEVFMLTNENDIIDHIYNSTKHLF